MRVSVPPALLIEMPVAAPGTQGAATGISINNAGGTETRPRNIALLAIIKF
jgi:hypothetical protein